MPNDWPFEDPKNVAVVTLRRIVFEGRPILRVSHDEEDGTWQFLDRGSVSVDDSAVVSLEEMTKHDPSILELFDLPLGWMAWREDPASPWRRAECVEGAAHEV